MEPEQLEMSLKRPELLEALSTPDAGPNQSLRIEPAPIIKRGTIAETMEDIVESNDPMQSGKVVEENDMAELVAEAENQALKRDCEFDPKSPSKKQKTDDCSPEESAPVDNALLENAGKVGKENPPQHMSKNARESRKYPAVKVYSVFEDLQIRSRKLEEEGEENSWTLCDYNDDLKYAVFRYFSNAYYFANNELPSSELLRIRTLSFDIKSINDPLILYLCTFF